MKKLILILTILILTACQPGQDTTNHILIDCIQSGSSERGMYECSKFDIGQMGTPQPTLPSVATATSVPSATPTVTVTPTFVMKLPDIQNDSFEGSYHAEPGGAIFDGWSGWFCDLPYTKQRCEVPVEWNPYQPYMRTPEFKVEEVADRVDKGKRSQHFFCAGGVCRAGIDQILTGLIPGETYTISAMGQMWIADGARIDPKHPKYDLPCIQRDSKNACIQWGDDLYHSDRATPDDLTAAFMLMGVDLTCNTQAFAGSVKWSKDYGYAEGLYDKYAPMNLTFIAEQDCAAIFIGGYSRFAKGHNDFYIDSVTITSQSGVQPTPIGIPNPTGAPILSATPTAPNTPVATSTPIAPLPTATPGAKFPVISKVDNVVYKTLLPVNIRSGYATTAPILGSYPAGKEIILKCIVQINENDSWGSTDACNITPAHWSAIRIGNTEYMRALEGPNGR